MYPYRYRDSVLEHHGIKGQKWGVRRFQNADGSVTAAGAQRYYSQYGKNYHTSDDPKNVPNHTDSKGGSSSSSGSNNNSSEGSKNQKVKSVEYGVATELIVAAAAIGVTAAAPLVDKGIKALKNKNLNTPYKKRLDQQRAGEEIDSETGLHKMSSPGTRESNMSEVNPDFKGYSKGYAKGTVQNCLLCTTAYEMRNRGYDCSAKKSVQPRDGLEYTNGIFKGVKNKPVEGCVDLTTREGQLELWTKEAPKCATKEGNKELAHRAVNQMQKEPDSRGQILVVWGAGGGHSMAYEVKGGKLSILDCQQNKVFEGNDAISLLSKTCHVQYQRLDNLEFDKKAIGRYCA